MRHQISASIAKNRTWMLTLLLPLAALMLLTQCKKDGNSTNAAQGKYYVRFKANGVQQEYRSDHRVSASASDVPTHPFGNNIDTYNFAMGAYGDESLAYPSIQFQIQTSKKLKLDSVYKTEPNRLVGSTNLYYLEKVETYEKYISYIMSKNVQVKFTERTGVYIKGTFSGTVYTSDNSKQVEISQGEFYAERSN